MANIVAVVTSDRTKAGGGLPIFYAGDAKETMALAGLIEKIVDAAAHRLAEDLYILVDRH
ncbi:capping complex subunit for YIEGIA [Cohnella fermenti]|uniref:Uncharacterized protein n=1 Tax=Cohnella fermenti TaxID=2565925 RepID=A0A4S4BUT9_9BACL|nr:hypothetical protein [Cohnella fermenti]THF78355.1 hypothetical protein E6C55_14145 [Cohnella fermenti]